jgi:putative redox protein
MSETLTASATLINQKVKFEGRGGENPPVILDYTPPYGDNEGYTSLQLFLISLCSCSGTALIFLLRKMQKTITDFSVSASGERREEHPTYFKSINLEFTINSPDTSDEDVQKVIALSEEKLCPVWGMIKNTVPVENAFKIITQ